MRKLLWPLKHILKLFFSSVNMDLTMGKMENELLACDMYWKSIFGKGKKPSISDWPLEVIILKRVHKCEQQIPVVPMVESTIQ